jgi:hypothetical protein
LVFAVFVVCASAGAGSAASGEEFNSFHVLATADGLRMTVGVPDAPVVVTQFADIGAPTSQAVLSSLGESAGFAAIPYPGDMVVNPPFTALGVPALPGYPLIARSNNPTEPEQNVTQPGYELHSKSDAASTDVAAQMAVSDSQQQRLLRTRSSSNVVRGATSTLEGRAEAVTEGFAAGPLQIARVRAAAKLVADGSQDPKPEATLEVVGMEVAGQQVAVTRNGLTLAGSSVPLPDHAPVLAALAEAGIAVRYLDGAISDGTAVSPTLEITVKRAIPNVGTPTATFTLARSYVRLEAGRGPSLGSGIDVGIGPEPSTSVPPTDDSMVFDGGAVATEGPQASPGSTWPSTNSGNTPQGDSGLTASPPLPDTPPAAEPLTRPDSGVSPRASAAAAFQRTDVASLYLPIVFAALALLVAMEMASLVRTRWTRSS